MGRSISWKTVLVGLVGYPMLAGGCSNADENDTLSSSEDSSTGTTDWGTTTGTGTATTGTDEGSTSSTSGSSTTTSDSSTTGTTGDTSVDDGSTTVVDSDSSTSGTSETDETDGSTSGTSSAGETTESSEGSTAAEDSGTAGSSDETSGSSEGGSTGGSESGSGSESESESESGDTESAPEADELDNAGFEVGEAHVTTPGWTNEGDLDAAYIEYNGSRTGWGRLGHWDDVPYTVSTFQLVSPLPNGTYSFSMWVHRGNDFAEQYLFARGYSDNPDDQMTISTETANDSGYTQIVLQGIPVTSGQVEVGIYSATPNANSWANIDDAELALEE